MPFMGVLQQAQAYQFELNAQSVDPNVRGAVTVYTIRRDRISEVESLPAVIQPAVNRQINQGVARIIFQVTPAAGGSIMFRLTQGAVMIEQNLVADAELVFDVV